MAKRLMPIVALAILLMVAYAITRSSPEATTGKVRQPAPLVVDVLKLERQDYQVKIASYGTIQPKNKVELHTNLSAEVMWVSDKLKAGAYVEVGDLLLKLDASDYELALQEATSGLASAQLALADEQARSRQAAREWSRELDTQPETEFALRKPQLASAEAGLKTARARLDQAELNLQKTQIRANFSGRLQSVNVDRGMYLNPGALIAQGYEIEFAEIRLPIANDDLDLMPSLSLVPSPKISFDANQQQWLGELVRTEAAIDSSTQQVHWVAEIATPFGGAPDSAPLEGGRPLSVGQYVEANIEGQVMQGVLVVPNASIYQGTYVYVVEQGALLRRNIEVRWRNQQDAVIAAGLKEGDLLVTTALGQVSTGTRVSVQGAEGISRNGEAL